MNRPTRPISVYVSQDEYIVGSPLPEKFAVATSRLYQPNGTIPAVIYCHGFGGDGPSLMTGWDGAPNIVSFGMRLAEIGYPVIAGDFHRASDWGNGLAMQAINAARLWIQGPPYYAKPGKVIMIGGSLGALNSVQYWRYNPSGGAGAGMNVYCVVGSIPLSSLDYYRTIYDGNVRDAINAAWGLTLGSTSIYPTQATGPAWAAGTTYPIWSVVSRLGSAYLATAVSVGLAPESNPSRWQLIVPSTSNAVLPAGAGTGDPAAHLSELATMPYLVSSYSLDDASIEPVSVATLSDATLAKERHAFSGLGGHTDAAVGASDMDNVISFIQRYAGPLPTGGYV